MDLTIAPSPLRIERGLAEGVGGRMHRAIYDKLRLIAKAGVVTTYSEIAPLAGLDMSLPDDRNRIREILGEISTAEHAEGRPLLSAVVVHRDNNMPGHGFFTLAKQLGLHRGGDDFGFFIRELRRVHDCWAQNLTNRDSTD